MQELTITDYLNKLLELTHKTQVTDLTGGSIPLIEASDRAIEMIAEVRLASGKVMLGGNGGSAAIASHAENDLSESGSVRAMVFTEQPVLTARSNDFGYGSVFERPIEMWAEVGDILVTISSSGQSENIVRALKMAREKQCKLITFSGFDPDNPSRKLGDLNFYVPSNVYAYVETAHMTLIHYVTAGVTSSARKPDTEIRP